jgi:2-phosphosulfolactate phosphatase
MYYDQHEFDLRCEWGEHGVTTLAPLSDVVVIVDVLSFSTSVDIAVAQGAVVFPYPWRDTRAAEFAASVQAVLADPQRTAGQVSLSPQSLRHIPPGTRLVLPSPNGATLALAVKSTPVLAGCLRNAQAVAHVTQQYGSKIAVVPAGERWRADGSLRPAVEDLVGAGAILSYLRGSLSPEAVSAVTIFQHVRSQLAEYLSQCSSGKELLERGWAEDVQLAAELNVSQSAPVLMDGAFRRADAQAPAE